MKHLPQRVRSPFDRQSDRNTGCRVPQRARSSDHAPQENTMKVYTAHSRKPDSADLARDTDSLVFVKDGFSLWAAVVPLLWLLFNRMWIPLLGYLALTIGFSALTRGLGLSDAAVFPAALALGLLIGFEANALRRWSLERKGYRMVAIGVGATRDECERNIYQKLVARGQPGGSVGADRAGTSSDGLPAASRPGAKAAQQPAPIVGLFPEPGR
jgi:hypothetical protein